ncbi:DUF302 domain-containing protein [Photobacterium sp. SDRW27]|uniref:DUF302 domain-containing protein n=1 Tax=Photobacterium obscurum TaxID=2829490 RepID=UPI00224404D7|nr:DUF302 domain-containing protein [Photobacterium obscurum]MCW8329285.1 DUF302 domain-containing protein [Photobacterium obscurum]
MKKIILATILLFIATPSISAQKLANGIIHVPSDFSVDLTTQRMVSLLKGKGMMIFNQIKHSKAAEEAGINIRDTELIIFGNPIVGSTLMKCQQSVALDLPQKVMIWEDAMAKVWISYNDPRYLEKRHHISGCEEIITKVENVLAATALSASVK